MSWWLFVIQELTEVLNWKQLFGVEFCVAQKLSQAESWAQPSPFSGEQKTLLGQASDRAGACFAHSGSELMEVLRRCRVTHNSDVYYSGRSCLLAHDPPSRAWHLSGQSAADGLCLGSWTPAMLLLFFSYGALSGALINHWSKLPLKFPSMKWNPVLWISGALAYHHLPLSCPVYCCRRITAKLSLYVFFTIFCYIFTAAWVKLFSARRLNIGCKWEQIHSLMGGLVLMEKLK